MRNSLATGLELVLGLILMATSSAAQNVMFEDDFEVGLVGWTESSDSGSDLWRWTSQGECETPTAVASTTTTLCQGPGPGDGYHYLRSPEFFVGGPGPFELALDFGRGGGQSSTGVMNITLIDVNDALSQAGLGSPTSGAVGTLLPQQMGVPPISGGWSGRTVVIEFQYSYSFSNGTARPALLDNVVFRDSCSSPINYCVGGVNSVGLGASLAVGGSTYVSMNDLVLNAWGLPPGQNGVIFYGDAQVQVPFGDGYRCVGGAIFRLEPIIQSDAAGNVSLQPDFTVPPMNGGFGLVSPGSSWNFQFWYRDPLGGGSGFNLSNAVHVTFCQ